MPRIPQYADKYSAEDFHKAVKVQMALYGIDYYQDLAAMLGISKATMSKWLKNPKRFDVAALQKLIHVLHLDPAPILALLGYSKREIRIVGLPDTGAAVDCDAMAVEGGSAL